MIKPNIYSVSTLGLLAALGTACGADVSPNDETVENRPPEEDVDTVSQAASTHGEAFHANTGKFWLNGADTGIALKAGTNPSVSFGGSTLCAAVQASSGVVKVGKNGAVRTARNATGSPAVIAQADNCYAFYRTTDNQLEKFDFNANRITRWNVSVTSNPSVVSRGHVPEIWVAYRGGNGHLWRFDTQVGLPATDWGVTISTSSSPSLTATGAGLLAAYRGTTGTLWTVGEWNFPHDYGVGVASGTSPSLSDWGGNFVIAFTGAGTNRLWTLTQNDAGTGDAKAWPGFLAPGTRPDIRSGRILFQSTAGTLNVASLTTNSITDLKYGMAPKTSPAVY